MIYLKTVIPMAIFFISELLPNRGVNEFEATPTKWEFGTF